MTIIRVHLQIAGRVQGVGYRAFTHQQAQLQGLSGYVRNIADGRVEAVAEGSENAIEALIRACRRGPQLARVDQVQLQLLDATGEFSDFLIRR